MEGIELDPDKFALAVVQQYLKEHGYERALGALEQESGVLFVEDKLARGSQLLQMVYERIDARLGSEMDEGQGRKQCLEDLLAGGAADYPRSLAASLQGPQFPANIICLALWPQQRVAVAGLGDGSLRLFSYFSGEALGALALGSSGVLCLAIQPTDSGQPGPVVAVGCMDGSIHLVDTSSPSDPHLLCSAQPHRKYVVALKWSTDGCYLVSGSWDHSFAVLSVLSPAAGGGAGAAAVAGALQDSNAASQHEQKQQQQLQLQSCGWTMQVVHQEQLQAQVQDVEFLPGSGGGGQPSFLVALRGSNLLRQYTIAAATTGLGLKGDSTSAAAAAAAAGAAGAGAPAIVEQLRLNMNAFGDDHVSFSASHLAVSPGGEFVLVSADNGRLILFDLEGWSSGSPETAQLRNLYGLPVEQFHQFSAAWHGSGHYIMAAAAHGYVYIYHVGSAKVVEKIKAHDKNVRGLAYDAENNLLLTCSFDRSVKVFE